MEIFILAFVAGVLTILAPCVIPLLPIILTSSASNRKLTKPLTIIISLGVTIFLFTLVFKLLVDSFRISDETLNYFAGSVIVVYGIFLLFPNLWTKLINKIGVGNSSDSILHKGASKNSFIGDVIIGTALGPVFNSCSPTYFTIIGPIFNSNRLEAIVALTIYVLTISIALIFIAIFGNKLTSKLRWATDPNGKFRKGLGLFLVVFGILLAFGQIKQFEAYLIENSSFSTELIKFENNLRKTLD